MRIVEKRPTFLSHFLISLAAAAGLFLTYLNGVPQAIYDLDASHVTSAIAVLLAFSVVYIGQQAWRVDGEPDWRRGYKSVARAADSNFGHLAETLAVSLGMLGTVIGLSMQLRAAHGSVDSLGAFGTQFGSTGCGLVAMMVVMMLQHNLESGIRRRAAE